MALRRIPIRRIGNRPSLFMGGDREGVMFTGIISAVLIFAAQEFYTVIEGIALWIIALFVFRALAKSDPPHALRSLALLQALQEILSGARDPV